MNESNHRPDSDLLNQALKALRDAPTPTGPPAELIAATVAAVENRIAVTVPSETAREQRRRRIMRYVGYSSIVTAAVVLVAVLGGVVVSPTPSAASDWKRAIEKLDQVQTVTCKQTQTMPEPLGSTSSKITIREKKTRIDILNPYAGLPGLPQPQEMPIIWTLFYDLDQSEMVQLDHATKKAIRQLIDEKTKQNTPDFIASMRDLKNEESIQLIGEEKVEKVTAKKYSLDSAKFMGMNGPTRVTAWINPATDLPVKIVVESKPNAQKVSPLTFTYEDFKFDSPVDPSLLKIEIPKGYTVTAPTK